MAFAWTLVFLVLQGGHSYILLTANLDDVHTIAKQMAASPVASHLNRILRRASNIFNQQLRTGNDGNNRHSPRSQLQSTDDDDPHHHSYRRFADSQNFTKSYNDTRDHDHKKYENQESHKSRPRERGPKDNLEEKDEAQVEDKAIHEDTHERSGELEDRRKESHQWKERDDDIKVVRHENRDGDARSHPDENIFLGKNASFFLNAIKNIMETV